MLIYCATNLINGKMYIGQTTRTMIHRKEDHLAIALRSDYNHPFYNAIRKYGVDAFEWSVVLECDCIDELNLFEMRIIANRNTLHPYGYNLTVGGENRKPHAFTIEKCREATKRQFEDPENRKRVSQSVIRHFQEHPEAREAVSLQFKGKKRNPLSVERMIRTNTGKKRSAETCRKISEKATGRKHTEETKKKLSEASKNQINRVNPPNATGLKRSEETKRRMSEAQKESARRRKQNLESTIQT